MSSDSFQSLEEPEQLGHRLMAARDFRGAIEAYRTSVMQAPLDGRRHYLLGCALHENQDRPAAVQAYARAVELNPGDADAANNLGIVYHETGAIDKAVAAFQTAVHAAPNHYGAWTNLGIVLQALGDVEAAFKAFRNAVQIAPDHVPTLLALGNGLFALQRIEEAGEYFGKAAQIDPKNAEAFYGLGLAHQSLGHLAHAAEAYRLAADLSSKYSRLLELSFLQQLNASGDIEQRSITALEELIAAQRARSVVPVPPFMVMTLPVESSARTQFECARYWAECTYGNLPRFTLPPRASKPKIRLGYISPDFRGHPGSVLIAELLEKHHREHFEVFGYSLAPPDQTVFRQRIVAGCDSFIDLRADSLINAAERIIRDEIDILIDISGYTRHSRTGILAMRPAPIQVSYLGFPGTMGADFIDYILVDDYVVPAEEQPYFSERLVHLPGCYQVNTNQWRRDPTPTRAAVGLPDEAFVFCCFNNNYKITATMFRLWMRLLAAVPKSVLWLLEGSAESTINLRAAAANHGISVDRLIFAPKQPLSQHLARHPLADLFLDCYPVNAHTTAADALKMGLPLVTLSGRTFVSRVAGSLLRAVGLPELITEDWPSYEAVALRLAQEPARLRSLRRRLLTNIETSSLFDIESAVNKIEAAYRAMYARIA